MSADPMAVLAEARRLLDSGEPERALAAVAQALHGVDVEMQHLGHLGGRKQFAAFVLHHVWCCSPNHSGEV